MIEVATLTKLLDWVFAAKGAAEAAKDLRPRSWTNVEARFAVEEIGLGFSCNDKSWSPFGTTVRGHIFRVTALDPNLEKIAYMEGENSDESQPKVAINIKKFPYDLLREMFQMARCMREFERTENTVFARKYQSHRHQVLFLWKIASEERAERERIEQKVINLIAECLVDIDKNRIVFSARLVEDLGIAEQVDSYVLAASLADEFGLEIRHEWFGSSEISYGGGLSETVPTGVTVGDIVDHVWSHKRG